MQRFFEYGALEMETLSKADQQMAEVIQRAGKIERTVIPDLFEALVYTVIGQQISTKAQQTIWSRFRNHFTTITPEQMAVTPSEEMRQFGISRTKIGYIQQAAEKICRGTLNLKALYQLSDDQVCRQLTSLNGIGVWSAEMLMIFSMQRPDILSYSDAAIQRGLCMMYHHNQIDKKLFETYRKRFSPYGSVASFYIWAVANGTVA